jgi:hypothetical protein
MLFGQLSLSRPNSGAAVMAAAKNSKSLANEWAKTYRSLREKGNKRNEIAHGTLVTFHSKGTATSRLMPYYWAGVLGQPLGEIPESAMTIKQIEDARRAFRIGDARINKFSIALQSWLMKRS